MCSYCVHRAATTTEPAESDPHHAHPIEEIPAASLPSWHRGQPPEYTRVRTDPDPDVTIHQLDVNYEKA